MTIYDDRELSQAAAQPVECFRFIGTQREYLYTSYDIPLTVGGRLYDPVAIGRSTLKAGTQSEDSVDLEITMPVETELVLDYAMSVAPPDLNLIIYRVHRNTDLANDFVIAWDGPVSSFRIDGRECRLKVPSVFSNFLSGNVPTVCYQTQCNHTLFDSLCKVSRSTHSVATTVTSISSSVILIASNGGKSSGYFVGGEIVNTLSGERRLITKHSSLQLTINYPFANLDIGDTVEVTAGCNHALDHCVSKFSNAINFGGFPYMPNRNPFQSGV